MTMQQQVAIANLVNRFNGFGGGVVTAPAPVAPRIHFSAPTAPSVEAIPLPPPTPTPVAGGVIPLAVPVETHSAVTPIQLAAQPSTPVAASDSKTLYIVGALVLLVVLVITFRR